MNNDNTTQYSGSKTAAANLAVDANDSLASIKDNLTTLKSDVVELGRNVKLEGTRRLEDASVEIQEKLEDLKIAGSDEMVRLQDYVSANPGRSIAAAFAAGVLLTVLMGRK